LKNSNELEVDPFPVLSREGKGKEGPDTIASTGGVPQGYKNDSKKTAAIPLAGTPNSGQGKTFDQKGSFCGVLA